MSRLAYVLLAIVVWAAATWVFLDAAREVQLRRLADDVVVIYTPQDGVHFEEGR